MLRLIWLHYNEVIFKVIDEVEHSLEVLFQVRVESMQGGRGIQMKNSGKWWERVH